MGYSASTTLHSSHLDFQANNTGELPGQEGLPMPQWNTSSLATTSSLDPRHTASLRAPQRLSSHNVSTSSLHFTAPLATPQDSYSYGMGVSVGIDASQYAETQTPVQDGY